MEECHLPNYEMVNFSSGFGNGFQKGVDISSNFLPGYA